MAIQHPLGVPPLPHTPEGAQLPPRHGADGPPCAQCTLMSQLTTLCPVSLPSKLWLGERSRQMLFLQA